MLKRRDFLVASVATGLCALAGPAFAADKANPDKLRIALLPDENASTIIQNAQPLKKYLEEVLKKPVEIIVTTDYSSMIEAMRFGRIEVGYFGPFSYVLAKSKAPEIEPFGVGVEKGKPNYQSILIATADGPVKELADIKGKPFAFGDRASTSSHLAPRALLAKQGLIGDADYKVVHLGQHDAVARAVAAGQVPAGALSESIYRILVETKKVDPAKLRQLALSEPIPNYPMTMQGYLNPELKDAIKGRSWTSRIRSSSSCSASKPSRRPPTRITTCCATWRKCSSSTSPSCEKMKSASHTFDAILADQRRSALRGAGLVGLIVAACVAALAATGFFDAQRFPKSGPAIATLASEMVPPDFSRWQTWLRPLLDTLAMSIAGTALAVVFSLPLALLAAPNTSPHPAVYLAVRTLLAFLRSVPEIILGVLFVAAVGFGALPGVLGAGAAFGRHGRQVLCRGDRACRSQAAGSGARGRRDADAGHPARRSAAGAAAARPMSRSTGGNIISGPPPCSASSARAESASN